MRRFQISEKNRRLAFLPIMLLFAPGVQALEIPFGSGTNIMSGEYNCNKPDSSAEPDVFRHSQHITDAELADALKARGMTSVRLPLNEQCWLGPDGDQITSPGVYFHDLSRIARQDIVGSAYRDRVSAFVQELTSRDIYVVLDLLHRSGPDVPVDELEELQQAETPNAVYSVHAWRSAARRFGDNPKVVFDAFNEPQSISWECWRSGKGCDTAYESVGMQHLLAAIREFAPQNFVILSGVSWAEDLSGWIEGVEAMPASVPTHNLLAGFHPYRWFHDYEKIVCGQVASIECLENNNLFGAALNIHQDDRFGVVITETGQNVNWYDPEKRPDFNCQEIDFVDAVYQWSERYNVPVQTWVWNPDKNCSLPTMQQSEDSNWDGRSPSTYGQKLYDHLARLRNGTPECIDTDPVGDGWGWNGIQGCQISSTPPESGACIDTDPLGDGWGWDGVRGCRITNNPQPSRCVDTDPIGDGWGWDGTKGCRITTSDHTGSDYCPPESDADGNGWGWDGTKGCRVN